MNSQTFIMRFQPVFAILFAVSLFLLTSCPEDTDPINGNPPDSTTTLETLIFNHGGLNRTYSIYLPENLPANAPLIFVLHGIYESRADCYAYGFDQVADTAGFAVCYPQGSSTDKGIPYWNARLNLSTVDDIGFLTELAEFLQQEHDLDPDRTFCCGFSNGGYMSYTLACEAPGEFKAIASVAGLMSEHSWSNCTPTDPTPVLHIHGLSDNTVNIDGDTYFGGEPPLDVIINFWVALNNCTATDTVSIGTTTTAYLHRNGTNGNEVWCYLINNHIHKWPLYTSNIGINATEVIWEFFSKY